MKYYDEFVKGNWCKKIDVENLLRCDNVSEDTLPELKKFVTQELDNFARKLNYSLKRFSK